MIKKLLSFVLILVVILAIYVVAFRGIRITENFNILSLSQLRDKKETYTTNVNNYDNLVNQEYATALNTLEQAKKDYEDTKEEYNRIKDAGSYEQLLEFSREKEYQVEFLWVKLDLIAKNNNLKAQFNLEDSVEGMQTNRDPRQQASANFESNTKDINVTLIGDYLAIKDYIYNILIDLDLRFKAEDIVLEAQGEDVIATFKIKNVKIKM